MRIDLTKLETHILDCKKVGMGVYVTVEEMLALIKELRLAREALQAYAAEEGEDET